MATIDIDIEDYLDQVSTRHLIKELSGRNITTSQKAELKMIGIEFGMKKRDALIQFFDLHPSATLEDVMRCVKENWDK